jgi:GntR family transcriptional regulator, sialic acid-inducible nan operon repressor
MIGIPAIAGAIRRRKLYEEVASRIEAMIHDRHYLPGDQLPSERELMKQFGVGRPAVREALFSLQKMGLVAVNSGERARVTQPTPEVVVQALSGAARHLLSAPDGVRHFQGARAFFEVGLARYAAQHASDDDIRELARALEANRLALDDLRAFERTDVAFHYVLAVIPRNPIFTAIHEAMVTWLTEQRRITLQFHSNQKLVAYHAHEKIYQAIAARDPDLAERVIREHLDNVADTYWKLQEGDDGGIRRDGGLPAQDRNVRAFPQADRRKRPRLGPR